MVMWRRWAEQSAARLRLRMTPTISCEWKWHNFSPCGASLLGPQTKLVLIIWLKKVNNLRRRWISSPSPISPFSAPFFFFYRLFVVAAAFSNHFNCEKDLGRFFRRFSFLFVTAARKPEIVWCWNKREEEQSIEEEFCAEIKIEFEVEPFHLANGFWVGKRRKKKVDNSSEFHGEKERGTWKLEMCSNFHIFFHPRSRFPFSQRVESTQILVRISASSLYSRSPRFSHENYMASMRNTLNCM